MLPAPLSPAPFPDEGWLPYPCLTCCVAAVMLIEQPRVQWAPGVLRIVMLVASDLTGSGVAPFARSLHWINQFGLL